MTSDTTKKEGKNQGIKLILKKNKKLEQIPNRKKHEKDKELITLYKLDNYIFMKLLSK